MVTVNLSPHRVVDRPELRGRLDDALTRRLTVLVAPAGAGKSVLLDQWTRANPDVRVIPVEIDPLDDDPVRLVRKLLRGRPGTGTGLDLEALVRLGAGGLGRSFIDELTAELEPAGDVVFVFDDFHRLSNEPLIADLDALIARFPPNVHTIIATRVEPSGDTARYRLSGDLLEIRQVDLAMSRTHSAELLARSAGRELSARHIDVLVDKTEGWAAGLQLAGLTLKMREDPDEFISDFSGSTRLVGDYLSEQVLEALPLERRRSILRLSALDSMNSDLVAVATKEPAAQQLFEQLERESLFLIGLDDRREWFRFHHLFLELLRYRLRAELPGDEEVIVQRAAEWHLARDEAQTAVEYLTRIRQWDQVLEIILKRSPELFERGQITAVVNWLESVPESVRSHDLDAVICHGALLGLLGQGARAEDLLSSVVNGRAASLGQVATAETFLASLAQTRPHIARSLAAATRALELLALNGNGPLPDILGLTNRSSLETLATISGGRAHFLAGDLVAARRMLERALVSEGADYSLWRINALGALALVEVWRGRGPRAATLAREALDTAREMGLIAHWGTADAFLALALVALESGQPHQAAISLHEATMRAESAGRTQQMWLCHLAEALLAESTGGCPAGTAPSGPPPPVVDDRLKALRYRIRRANGSVDVPPSPLPGRAQPHCHELFEIALNAVRLDRLDLALRCLDVLASDARSDSPVRRVQCQILLAQIARAEANGAKASRHIALALDEASDDELVEIFVRAGPETLALVAASHDEAHRLRGSVLQRAKDASVHLPGTELQTPLTKRELEVLSYLPSYCSNQELAERCFVSVNTIKTHMVHIYQKLNAPNRSAAVQRAREIGLL